MIKMTDKNSVMQFTGTGDDREWKHYKMRALAHARTKGWQRALLEVRTLPTDSRVYHGMITEEETKHVDENNKAWEYLTKTCTGLALEELGLADGHAGKAWKSFTEKYEPNQDTDLITLKQKFETCKIQDFTSPEEWVMKLEILNLEMAKIDTNYRMSDVLLNSTIMSKLPSVYNALLPTLKWRNTMPNTLTTRELKKELQEYYEERIKERDPENLAMAVDTEELKSSYSKQPSVKNRSYTASEKRNYIKELQCYFCGETGHTQKFCRVRAAKEATGEFIPKPWTPRLTTRLKNPRKLEERTKVRCPNCNLEGHFGLHCPELNKAEEATQELHFMGSTEFLTLEHDRDEIQTTDDETSLDSNAQLEAILSGMYRPQLPRPKRKAPALEIQEVMLDPDEKVKERQCEYKKYKETRQHEAGELPESAQKLRKTPSEVLCVEYCNSTTGKNYEIPEEQEVYETDTSQETLSVIMTRFLNSSSREARQEQFEELERKWGKIFKNYSYKPHVNWRRIPDERDASQSDSGSSYLTMEDFEEDTSDAGSTDLDENSQEGL